MTNEERIKELEAENAELRSLIADAARLIPLYRKWYDPQEYREGMDGLFARLKAVAPAGAKE